MLFHLMATHSEDNCPAYKEDSLRLKVRAARKRYVEIAKATGVKVRFIGFGAPEHAMFAVIEAKDPMSVDHFWGEAFPYVQSFKLTAVTDIDVRNKEA